MIKVLLVASAALWLVLLPTGEPDQKANALQKAYYGTVLDILPVANEGEATSHQVTIEMVDGRVQAFPQTEYKGIRIGDRVLAVGNGNGWRLFRANA